MFPNRFRPKGMAGRALWVVSRASARCLDSTASFLKDFTETWPLSLTGSNLEKNEHQQVFYFL